MAAGEMSEGVREQVTKSLRELDFSPKGHTRVY
jgi:hypothetical protein